MGRSSTDDIREWGEQNGWDVSGDRLPPGLRAAYDGREDAGEIFDPHEPIETMGEIPPVVVKPSVTDKARSIVDRVKRTAPAKTSRVKAKARVSVDKFVSSAWSLLAVAAERVNPPVSRVLAMQAPVAGLILEDTVKNSVADRVLQPLARATNGGETAMALMGPPLIVAAITMRPDRANVLVPLLKVSLRSWVSVAGERLEKIQEQEQAFEENYGKRIDEMIEYILEPMSRVD